MLPYLFKTFLSLFCECAYVHTCKCAYVCVCTWTYRHVCMHACVCISVCGAWACVSVCVCVPIHVCRDQKRTFGDLLYYFLPYFFLVSLTETGHRPATSKSCDPHLSPWVSALKLRAHAHPCLDFHLGLRAQNPSCLANLSIMRP